MLGMTGIARGRRRIVALGAVAIVIVAVGAAQAFSAFAAGSPSRPIDRDLSSYVLFGLDSLSLKGGDLPGRGVVRGGDIGAGGIDTDVDDSDFVMDICANHGVTTDDGSQVNADSMRITKDCSIWDVYANHVNPGADVVPRNSGPNPFTTPLLRANPSFPSFSCNAANPFTAEKDATVSMSPGAYGAVNLKDGSHTTLSSGVYTMCDFNAGKNASVTTSAGSELRIEKTFSISNDTTFGPECNVPVYVRGDGASGANDNAVTFSSQTQVAGRFLTLTGHINLGDDTDLTGQFVGRNITSDKNINVNGCHGAVVTTTTSPGATSSTATTPTSTSPTTGSGGTSTTVASVTTLFASTSTVATTLPGSSVSANTVSGATAGGNLPLTGGGGMSGVAVGLAALMVGGACLGLALTQSAQASPCAAVTYRGSST